MDRSKIKETIRLNFYLNNSNYHLVKNSDKKEYLIFVSSNGLDVTIKDRFEWNNISQRKEIRNKFGKILFLRDPFANFYLQGINSKVSSIDDVIEFVKKILQIDDDSKISIMSYSSGAYLSLILASSIGCVKRIVAFSPIVSLYEWSYSDIQENQYFKDQLEKLNAKEVCSKYFDISKIILNIRSKVLVVYPSLSTLDNLQINKISKLNNIFRVGIRSSKHSVAISHMNYVNLICSNDVKFKKFCQKINNLNMKSYMFTIKNLKHLYLKEWIIRILHLTKRLVKK